jgi:AraC-like DNA-binding protein
MLFQFNIYSSLLIPFVLQGIIISVLLFVRSRRSGRTADLFLATLLFLYALRVCQWMLGFAGWYDIKDWHTTIMFYTPFHHWLAIGPLIYFYFKSVTNSSFRFTKKDWLHFIPEFVWLLRFLFIFVMDIVVNHWIKGDPLPYFDQTHGYFYEHGIGISMLFWNVAEYLSVFTYLILTLRLYRKYRSYITNEFANTEHIDFSWIRNFLIANLVGHIVWIGFDLADYVVIDPLSYVQDWYSFFFLGVLIYYLSISGYSNRPEVRQEADLHFDPHKFDEAKNEVSPQNDETINELLQQLLTYMEMEKPYLNPSINLTQLSKALITTPALLSKSINTGKGMNFNDFINKYRVEMVKEKLQSEDAAYLSLLAIALDCGFNSKATFNRAFKKHTGIPPSVYFQKTRRDIP